MQQQQQQQQPQQPKLEDDTQSVWTQRATWESRAGVRDDTKHATKVRATRQLVLPTSEAKDDTHLTVKEELTDTNIKAIQRIKVGSNKFCIQEDLAKEKLVCSIESSQAIFNMGKVELIELKKTTIQCPSCLHCVSEGTFLCNCGKLLKLEPGRDQPNQGSIRDSESTFSCISNLYKRCQMRTKSMANASF